MYPSPLKGINSTVLSNSETWMTAATHSEFSIKSNFCLKDIPTSPGLCFDEEKVHNRWCRDPDRVPASSPENFQLNKDSQTEFFSQPRVVVSAVSIQKNL